jgi:uncharacterized MAPEG superfamily protein
MSPISALASFGLLTLCLIGFEIMYTYATKGFGFGFSSNRPDAPMSQFGIRVKRTLQNHIESSAYIVPALGLAIIADMQGEGVELAALLIILGRAAYAILYYIGLPFIRVPAFVLGTLSSFYLMVAVLLPVT